MANSLNLFRPGAVGFIRFVRCSARATGAVPEWGEAAVWVWILVSAELLELVV